MRATSEFHFLPLDRFPVRAHFQTDRGAKRPNNEDAAVIVIPDDPSLLERKGILAVVADGMGGREGGEYASRLATERVAQVYYESTGPGGARAALQAAFADANAAIYAEAQRVPSLGGMGTTCVAVAVINGVAHAANVGDSRVYLVRAGRAYRMTEDDSATMLLVSRGVISRADAARHTQRNVILRALGTRPVVEPAAWKEPFPLHPQDRLVLCSDGLHETLSDDEIARLAAAHEHPADACAAMVSLALERECADNVTAAAIYLRERAAAEPAG